MSDYQDCKRCYRTMRPRRTSAAEHPDTIPTGSRGLCQTCYRIDQGYEAPADRAPSSLEHNRASLIAYFRSRGRTITL